MRCTPFGHELCQARQQTTVPRSMRGRFDLKTLSVFGPGVCTSKSDCHATWNQNDDCFQDGGKICCTPTLVPTATPTRWQRGTLMPTAAAGATKTPTAAAPATSGTATPTAWRPIWSYSSAPTGPSLPTLQAEVNSVCNNNKTTRTAVLDLGLEYFHPSV